MKHCFLSGIIVASSLVAGLKAEARNYFCKINYPTKVELKVSPEFRVIQERSAEGTASIKVVKIKRYTMAGETRDVLLLEDGSDLQISLTDAALDYESGIRFPYGVSYRGTHGGCELEDANGTNYVARYSGIENKLGLAVVGGWPGIYGDYHGYKVTNDVTLPAGSTWKTLTLNGQDQRTCTLKKETRLFPIDRKSGEFYRHVVKPQKFIARGNSGLSEDDFAYRRGDQIIALGEESDGYCLVEKEGVRYDIRCGLLRSGDFVPVDTAVDVNAGNSPQKAAAPAPGNYVYTHCREGHLAWVPTSLMKADTKNFYEMVMKPW